MSSNWEDEFSTAIAWDNEEKIESLLSEKNLHQRDQSGKSWLAQKIIAFKKDGSTGWAGDAVDAGIKHWLKSYDQHQGVMDISPNKSQHWLEYLLTASNFGDHAEKFKVRYAKLIPDDLLIAHSQVLGDYLERRGAKREINPLVHEIMKRCVEVTGEAPHFKALIDATLLDRRLSAMRVVYGDNDVAAMHTFEKQGGDPNELLEVTRMNLRYKPLTRYLNINTARKAQEDNNLWFKGLKMSTFGGLFLSEKASISDLLSAGMNPRQPHYEWKGRQITIEEISLAYVANATKTALKDSNCEELVMRLKSLENADQARSAVNEILGLRASNQMR